MITLYKNYKYDNRYEYIKCFASATERANYFNNLARIYDESHYVRDSEPFIVDYNYDYLRENNINYLKFNNGFRDIYAFIIKKEYVNDHATRIYYEIDVIMTYQFDFNLQESFIERKNCTIEEITDFDEGLALGEHKIVSDTIAFDKGFKYFALFSGIKNFELVMDENGKIVDYLDLPTTYERPMTMIDNVLYPLFFIPLTTNSIIEMLSDHPSLVAIVRFPDCTYTEANITIPKLIESTSPEVTEGTTYQVARIRTKCAISISSANVEGSGGTVAKAEPTDFFPYTYYVLTDNETEPMIMYPQDLPSAITVKGKYALSNTPIERFYVEGYKGDTTGNVYNITNTSVMTLPTATNTGLAYLSSNAGMMQLQLQNIASKATVNNTIAGIGIAGAIAGGALLAPATGGLSLAGGVALAGGIAGGASSIASTTSNAYYQTKEADRRAKDMALTPNSISSLGTPSTRNKFGTNSVRVLKYTVSDAVKAKVRAFHTRFGHKYNNYDTINLRSYKGYLKVISPSLTTGIDNQYKNVISSILERGVYIE